MLSGVLVIFAAAGLSACGFLFVSRYVPDRWLVADSAAASALYATIGMVYAILIALAAITVWEPHSAAAQSTEQEAADLAEAYWSARSLPQPERDRVRGLIVQYSDEVATVEWELLRTTRLPAPGATELMERLRTEVAAFVPADEREAAGYQELVGRVTGAADARRTRVSVAAEGMPYPMWPILILGGLVSVGFLYLFGLERTFPNGLMMATVGGMLALLLFVLYQVEYPFSRGFAIEPDAFTQTLSHIGNMS